MDERAQNPVYHPSELAACSGRANTWSDAWYSDDKLVQRYAKEICARCPVIDWCRNESDKLEIGTSFSSWHGIWAGETRWERRKRRRKRLERGIFD